MKKLTKYLAAVCGLALLGALFVGCSGQASSGSAQAGSSASNEALLQELQNSTNKADYKSVTLDLNGEITIDYAAILSANSSSSSASADASASADSSQKMSMPMKVSAKSDLSGEKSRMYMNMDMLGQSMEAYINGEDAVIVMYGQAISATLDEIGLSGYGSVEEIMSTQTVDLNTLKDALKSIEKTTENGETVYSLVVDLNKLPENAESSLSSLTQLGVTMDDALIVYSINSDGYLDRMEMVVTGTGISSNIEITLSDFNNTVVPEAPQATVSYSDLMNGTQQSSAAAAAA